jgi:hypothetical protein
MPSAHLHLMVRAEIVNPPGVNDVEAVNTFMTTLVDKVRMKVLSPAITLWCDEPGNEGITSSILLTTSNSVVHIWNYEDGTGLLEFDLYSMCSIHSGRSDRVHWRDFRADESRL